MWTKTVSELGGEKSVFIYVPDVLDTSMQGLFLKLLDSQNDFKNNKNYNEDKIIRKQKWYQKNGKYFCEKWKYKYDRWESHDYYEQLIRIQEFIQKFINKMGLDNYGVDTPIINSCLINKYRNGNDYIRPHQDTADTFGKTPTIVGLSLGETRKIVFKHMLFDELTERVRPDKDLSKNFEINLESGSLFIMAGASQKYFTHEIPKEPDKSLRYSLTFRQTLL